jgi:RNA polymerase sigma-70 factor (ECF subfamily)
LDAIYSNAGSAACVQKLTDEQLMEKVLDKNRPALEEIYDRYGKLVYSFAMKSTRNTQTSKEITQTVFIRLWTTERGYDANKGQFVSWLLTITRNITIDYIRKERKHTLTLPLESKHWNLSDEDDAGNPEHFVTRNSIKEQIRDAYRFLTDGQVHLLEMLYWKGYTLSEIAQLNQEPIGTVKSRLHQALKILRKKLYVIREERF